MFEGIKSFWDTYGFEFLFFIAIVAILVIALFRIGKKGSYEPLPKFRDVVYREVRLPDLNLQEPKPETKRIPHDSKGEVECRRIMESLFDKPFPKIRPDFLRNPVTVDYNLEIDCYNPELKLGVEYNGVQHYKFSKFFHKNFEAFRNQQYRDLIKRSLCKEHGINLIEVPYTIKVEDIGAFIAKELVRMGFGGNQ